MLYLRCRVLNNDYIFSNLKLKFYRPQQYSPYGATLSADIYCLHTHMMSIYWARGGKFKSSESSPPPRYMVPSPWVFSLHIISWCFQKKIKTKQNKKQHKTSNFRTYDSWCWFVSVKFRYSASKHCLISVAVLQGIEQLEPCIIPFQEGKSQFTCQYKMNVLIAYAHNIIWHTH